jgi:UDP-N-acetylmuramoyl-tripeptide--D-alanyl-D-alanine ligase
MRKIAQFILKYLAQAVLWRHKPFVVGVTGSVGKTMAKDAVVHMLQGRISVRGSEKNYNNEVGVPVTILGVGAPGYSPVKWVWVILKWIVTIIYNPRYPEVLVLEMGVDRPNDMGYLLSIVRPNIAVVTSIASSHLEFFGSIEGIAEEKGKLVEGVKKGGTAILNADDSLVWAMRKRTEESVVAYGFQKRADIRAFNVALVQDGGKIEGLHMKVEYRGKTIPLRLKKLLGKHQSYGVLVAFAVADAVKINLLEAANTIEDFTLPPGRLQPLRGKNNSWILDDSYNASPLSTLAALETLKTFEVGRKIVVLGDMLELGIDEKSGHRSLAKSIVEVDPARAVLVGRRMQYLETELFREGFDRRRVSMVESPMEVSEKLLEELSSGDIILVKGSRGMRMELAVEALVDESVNISEKLCCQDREWKKKEFKQP